MEPLDEYRCWYDLLRLSDRTRWSEKVERVFGDVAELSFSGWWRELKPLFERVQPFTVEVITDAANFNHFNTQYPEEDGMVVFFHLLAPRTALLADFQKLLDARHAGRPGRPKHEDWSDLQMVRKPDVRAIRKVINVYKASVIEHKGLPQWRIGELCKVNLSRLKGQDDPDDERHRKRILSITVSSHMKRAKTLIRGVERGVFPAKDDETPCPW
ncbi:hypothetical protein [Roseateles sp. PN1]|uniref:hypothetical protein n=1 Tax=Roseateles sp. PN1 TaxID=3137372 RepID=UPI003139D315